MTEAGLLCDQSSLEEIKFRKRYNSAVVYKLRRKVIDQIKLWFGCVDCGYREHPAALSFDHRDPDEKWFKIASSCSRNWIDLLAEMAKCDVRCSNCHAIKTFENGDTKKFRREQ